MSAKAWVYLFGMQVSIALGAIVSDLSGYTLTSGIVLFFMGVGEVLERLTGKNGGAQ